MLPTEDAVRVHSVDDVARILRVSRTTVYRLRDAGDLRVTKIRGRTVITESELARYLETLEDRRPAS